MKTKVKPRDAIEQIITYAILIMLLIGSATACGWLFKVWAATNGILIR